MSLKSHIFAYELTNKQMKPIMKQQDWETLLIEANEQLNGISIHVQENGNGSYFVYNMTSDGEVDVTHENVSEEHLSEIIIKKLKVLKD